MVTHKLDGTFIASEAIYIRCRVGSIYSTGKRYSRNWKKVTCKKCLKKKRLADKGE